MSKPPTIRHLIPSTDKLLSLYADAGWAAYTHAPEQLRCACEKSLCCLTAWQDDQLIGLIRAVGDGETILYIQDLLVHSRFRRRGIGSRLLQAILAEFPHVRQKVLIADDSPELDPFYRSAGFSPAEELHIAAYMHP